MSADVQIAVTIVSTIIALFAPFVSYGWGRSDGYNSGWEDALRAARIKEANNGR